MEDSPVKERIKVGVRLRPSPEDSASCVTVTGKRLSIPSRNAKGVIDHSFDQVFGERASQRGARRICVT